MGNSESDGYAAFSDGRIKHMQMIQSVIARLGSNGFVVKGWAITLAGAFAGFAMTRDHLGLAAVGVAVPSFFWFLDATYLRSERAFRLLYERVRTADETSPFFMNATEPRYLETLADEDSDSLRWRTVIWRPGLSIFYGTLIASAMAVMLVLAATDPGDSEPSVPNDSLSDTAD